MRHVAIFGFLASVMVLAGCGGSTGRLAGAWELVSSGGDAAAAEDSAPQLVRTVKILSDGHFAFGQRTLAGDVAAGGGRYTLEGSTYVESVDYHYMPALVGLDLRFDCRLEGDLWHHSGEFRIGDERLVIDEVWRKIEE